MQRLAETRLDILAALYRRLQLQLLIVADDAPIPGSYWGAPEAGLIGQTLYVRSDTPVHSLLHETCHVLLARARGEHGLHTDAGGSDLEECAVCVLQIHFADHVPGSSAQRLMADMDAWGYSFRLGSTEAWFNEDAEDARQWLAQHAQAARVPDWLYSPAPDAAASVAA
jgi:hypothetical protein